MSQATTVLVFGADFAHNTHMPLKLYELVGTDASRPFSPFCWRTRMALAHKGLSAETIPWCFTEKSAIAPHRSEKVPVLLDGDSAVVDSWTIANYLEDTYPDRPSLFGGEGGRAMGRMLNWWGDVRDRRHVSADHCRHPAQPEAGGRGLFPQKPRGALRQAAGRNHGQPRQGGRGFSQIARSAAADVEDAAFLGGAAANYADYIVFGAFQWARVVSPFKLLIEDDPVYAWRERLLDAFDGMARKSPGYHG